MLQEYKDKYEGLSNSERDQMINMRKKAAELYAVILSGKGNDLCRNIALDQLDECIMWAMKGIVKK